MVLGVPALLLGAVVKHRELHDPQEVVATGGNQLKPPGQLEPQRAEHRGGDPHLVGDDQQQITGSRVETLADGGDLLGGQELGDR